MPVRRPRFPRGSQSRAPGPGQGSLFPNIVPEVRAVRRTRTQPETQQQRAKTVGGQQRATAPPRRAIQTRGSQLGRLYREGEEPSGGGVAGFPQIDPTRTTNPQKPRTLQAGYDAENRILRVRFRDGTPWEYYDVPPNIWHNFRRVQSPGRFINRVLNSYPYGRGEF